MLIKPRDRPQRTPYHMHMLFQIVVMSRNDGDGWMLGKSGEDEGLFPENYVERVCVV